MADATSLYKQLEILAKQNQTDVERLILQIQGMSIPTRDLSVPDKYAQLLMSATSLVSDMRSVETVLSNWYEYVDQIVTYDLGVLLIYEENHAVVRYFHNKLKDSPNVRIRQTWELSLIPSVSRNVSKPKTTILDDTQRSQLLQFLDLPTIQNVIMMPVANNGGVMGLLVFMSQESPYAVENLQNLTPFINILSGLLQNDQLITTIYQSTDELASLYHATSVLFQADTLEDFSVQITEVVARTFDYADCGLMIVDEDQKQIIRMRRSGPEVVEPMTDLQVDGKGLVPKAIREGRLVYEPDVRSSPDYIVGDVRSLCELVVPLKSPQGILGVLDFQSLQTHAFNERDQRLVVALAERVAPALENVLLYEQLRQHMAELEDRVEERTSELQNTKEQLEIILRNSPDAIVLLDSRGYIMQANLSWLTMIGKSMYEIVGKRLSDFLPKSYRQAFQDVLSKTLQDELENDIIVEIPNTNRGSATDIEISLAPIIDEHDSGVVCNIRDMTQHKESERLLREALNRSEEMNQLKANLVTMTSHEFRTPLTTILSSSDIVAQYQERLSPDKIRRHMLKINREVEYLNGLIDDILLLSRGDDERFIATYRKTDLQKMIDQIMERIHEIDNNEHPIHIDIADNAQMLITDGRLLTHVIENLLTNACKYSEKGKPISVILDCDDALKIRVTDEGIGIPDKDRDMLLESFYRGSNVGNIRGTGIGLAIVNEVLVAMNGQIEIQSQVNKGTTVEITIPVPSIGLE